MKKSELCKIIEGLLCSKIDGTRKDFSGWHIDYIMRSLLTKKDLWYQKSLEYFVASYLVNHQIHTPWNIELAIYLNDCTKKNNLNIDSLETLYKNLPDAPPEIIAYTRKAPATNPTKISRSFIPAYMDCVLSEKYDQHNHTYRKTLILSIQQAYKFRVMVARLFKHFSFDCADLDHIRLIDKRRISSLKKLCYKNQATCAHLVELGALLLLAQHDINDALLTLNNALKLDPQNTEAHFWLATIYYYCLDNVEQAQHYIDEALRIDPSDARCLSFMYIISWRITNSQEKAISCLEAAIKIQPDWLLPRIQLALFFIYSEKNTEARKILLKLKILKKVISNNIIDRYYATYVTGNISSNIIVTKLLIKLSRLKPRVFTDEEAAFLKKIGFTVPQKKT